MPFAFRQARSTSHRVMTLNDEMTTTPNIFLVTVRRRGIILLHATKMIAAGHRPGGWCLRSSKSEDELDSRGALDSPSVVTNEPSSRGPACY